MKKSRAASCYPARYKWSIYVWTYALKLFLYVCTQICKLWTWIIPWFASSKLWAIGHCLPYTYSGMWPEIEKILEIPNSEVKFLQNILGSVIFTKSYVNFHSSLVLTGFVFMLCHQSGIYITAFCYALQIEFRQSDYEALVNKFCKLWSTSGMLCRFFKVFIELLHTCRNGCPVNNSVPKRYRSLKIYNLGGFIPKSCLFWRQFELKIGKLACLLQSYLVYDDRLLWKKTMIGRKIKTTLIFARI